MQKKLKMEEEVAPSKKKTTIDGHEFTRRRILEKRKKKLYQDLSEDE